MCALWCVTSADELWCMCAVCGGVLICVACYVLLSCVLCVSGAVLCLACVRCAWWTIIQNVQNKPEKYDKHEKKAQKCEGKESVECFASRLLVSLLFSRVTTSLTYDTPEARKEGHVARTNRDNIIIDDLHPPRTAVRRDREGGRRTCPHTKTGPKTASTCRNGQTLWKPEWSTMSFAMLQAQNSYRKYTINVNHHHQQKMFGMARVTFSHNHSIDLHRWACETNQRKLEVCFILEEWSVGEGPRVLSVGPTTEPGRGPGLGHAGARPNQAGASTWPRRVSSVASPSMIGLIRPTMVSGMA